MQGSPHLNYKVHALSRRVCFINKLPLWLDVSDEGRSNLSHIMMSSYSEVVST